MGRITALPWLSSIPQDREATSREYFLSPALSCAVKREGRSFLKGSGGSWMESGGLGSLEESWGPTKGTRACRANCILNSSLSGPKSCFCQKSSFLCQTWIAEMKALGCRSAAESESVLVVILGVGIGFSDADSKRGDVWRRIVLVQSSSVRS